MLRRSSGSTQKLWSCRSKRFRSQSRDRSRLHTLGHPARCTQNRDPSPEGQRRQVAGWQRVGSRWECTPDEAIGSTSIGVGLFPIIGFVPPEYRALCVNKANSVIPNRHIPNSLKRTPRGSQAALSPQDRANPLRNPDRRKSIVCVSQRHFKKARAVSPLTNYGSWSFTVPPRVHPAACLRVIPSGWSQCGDISRF